MNEEQSKARKIMYAGLLPLVVGFIVSFVYAFMTNTMDLAGPTVANQILLYGALISLSYYILLLVYVYLPRRS